MVVFNRSRRLVSKGQDGFTLLELIVALLVSSILLILVLNLLDLNTRVGRVQTDLSTVQQAQRVVHNLVGDQVRMAGRGGLTVATALNIADNVSSGFQVAGNDTVDGSDVLRIRGAFENYFEIDTTNTDPITGSFRHDTTTGEGRIRVDSVLPSGLGVPGGGVAEQSLDDLEDAIDDGIGLALILVSSQNNATFAVVELLTGPSSVAPFDVDGSGSVEAWERRATLVFDSTPSNSVNNALFADLSSTPGIFPPMTRVANVGILQEYQYYVRDTDEAAEGNRPKLSRAEFLPNTPTVMGDASNGRIDIADNVGDFQIARGFDVDGDSQIDENYDHPENDEWLGNNTEDGPPTSGSDGYADEAAYLLAGWDLRTVTSVAISSLILAERTDRRYLAPAIDDFENHAYSEADTPVSLDALIQRRLRRRLHRTVVEMRNL